MVCGGPKGKDQKWLLQKPQRLLLLPYSHSLFFRNHINAVSNASSPKYNKTNAKWQWEVFEKVTGKANAHDVFAKITDDFSSEFPGFFTKQMAHTKLLSMSVGERQWGKLRYGTDDAALNVDALVENAFEY